MRNSLAAKYRELFPPIPEDIQQEFRQARPFYILVEMALLTIYTITLYLNPELRRPAIFIPFTLLMFLHGWLHWVSPRLAYDARFLTHYLVIQGALALGLIVLTQAVSMVFGLYFALIGEILGILRGSKLAVIASVVYFFLSAISYVLITDPNTIGLWVVTAIPSVAFTVIYVTMFVRQLLAREQAQKLAAELEIANRQLSEYATQVEDLTIANERQRMARELHDTLAQGLAGLILQLEAVDAHLTASRPERAQAIIRQTMEQARSTLADARGVIDDLRRAGPLDLKGALRLEASRFSAATDIPCDLQLDLDDPLPQAIQEALQRIVAEALTNIAHYAQASHASVALSVEAGMLLVKIHDDGVGFDPSTIPAGHYGLVGMRERVRLVDGTMEIESAPGQGALLRLRIPLQPER